MKVENGRKLQRGDKKVDKSFKRELNSRGVNASIRDEREKIVEITNIMIKVLKR